MNCHIIKNDETLLDALCRINILAPLPLVLFVVDSDNRMVGTLTDGDSRRALIAGARLDDTVDKVMLRKFRKLTSHNVDNIMEIRRLRQMGMKLIPILDDECHIVDILDLQQHITRLPVDAILMAGGEGKRLRPLTENTPKPLLPLGDKAVIDYSVDRLISFGINHISVTVNYLKEQIEKHFERPHNGVKVETVCEPKYLGTIGSIKFVPHFYNDSILLMNSDLLTDIDFEDFYIQFIQNDAEMSVATISYNVSIPYGILELDGRNVIGLAEKPQYQYSINAGIYLIKRSVLQKVPDDIFFNATDLIEKLISENKKVIRYPLNGTWIDIGTLKEYQNAQDLVNHFKH